MQLRAPSVPLITVDPYFSVWSPADKLTDANTVHWTGKPNTIIGTAEIDGAPYRFMGAALPGVTEAPAMTQTDLEIRATSTAYVFEAAGVILTAVFSTPLLADDLELASRPVSFMSVNVDSADGEEHKVKVRLSVSEEICLDCRGQGTVHAQTLEIDGMKSVCIGSDTQDVLNRSGDDVRIDWGHFYLTGSLADIECGMFDATVPFVEERRRGRQQPVAESGRMTFVYSEAEMCTCHAGEALFTFAYDDVKSIQYFGENLTSLWNAEGKTITEAIAEAHKSYADDMDECDEFENELFSDAVRAGGEKYAELLELAYRQSFAAHKIAIDPDGEILFISKECFSNGCAATVDVSYPSIPMYLIYNPELVRGMMRPVIKFARSDKWIYDFAPHDAGQYPLVNGQVYNGTNEEGQMPVEECGNMLVMFAAEALASDDVSFAEENLDLCEKWVGYLEKFGEDPAYQLCTDDFAGHLAHNCNLSLKAIMGIASLGIIYDMLERYDDRDLCMDKARAMAISWAKRAANGDGSYRLAFDREGSFSMKYNIVWDKLFGTDIIDSAVIASECATYRRKTNAYGLPLDNRRTYTKSDWLVWTATLYDNRDDFMEAVATLWSAYNCSPSRVPLTDWYDTVTSRQVGFQNRTVQGGLFVKLLDYYGIVRL